MHTQKPTVSKRTASAITGAGMIAFSGIEGGVHLFRTISIIRIIKGR
ncbi:MAG TPA: hypothetical protein VEC35_04650 [Noviherbaspirillum sp.]|nr:hypothetical protein [Noviherbaspirillum sp.]